MADSTSCRQALRTDSPKEGEVWTSSLGARLLREGKLGRRTSVGRTRQAGPQLCREMAIRRRQVVVHKSKFAVPVVHNRIYCRFHDEVIQL